MAIWHNFTTPAQQAAALAAAVAQQLTEAVQRHGQASIALSGGRSPIAFLQALNRQPLPWRQLTITLVDERVVPPDHPNSNARLLREHLLHGAAADAHFIPLVTQADQPERDVQRLQSELPRLDVAVLGMGEDGHTASLFPGVPGVAAALADDCPQPVMLFHPAQTVEARLSLTWPPLSTAGALFLPIQGARKLAVAQHADAALPVSRFLTLDQLQVYWAGQG